MSTPLDRLRKAIDNVTIQYRASDQLSKNAPMTQALEAGCGGCCCQCIQESQIQTMPDKTTYYTEEQLKKVVNLYEEEQCKLINLKEKHRQQISNLKEELQRYKQDNKRLIDQREAMLLKVSESTKVQQKIIVSNKTSSEKQRLHREEIERTNLMLQDLNKQINEERSKRKAYEQKIVELQLQLQKLQDLNKRIEDRYRKQITETRVQNQEFKKMIEYQILMKSKELAELHQQYDNKLRSKDIIIQDLEKYISQLESNLNAQKDISHKLAQAIKNYEISILNLNREDQQRTEQKQHMKNDLTARINTLVTEVQRLGHIERRNIELQQELEQERGRDKYHIVQVKDNSKDIELQVVRRQLKQLIQEKVLFEARLKKMCKCKSATNIEYKHTLVEYDNKPKLEEYLKTHQVILRKDPTK